MFRSLHMKLTLILLLLIILSTHEGIDMSKSRVWTYRKIRKNLAEFIGEKYKLTDLPLSFKLLPDLFTLTQLQHVFEAVIGEEIDKRNFRKSDCNNLPRSLPGYHKHGKRR